MPSERREKLAEGILDIVQKRSQLIVFATVVDKRKMLFGILQKAMPDAPTSFLQEVLKKLMGVSLKEKSANRKESELTRLLLRATDRQMNPLTAEATAKVLVEDFEKDIFDLAFKDVLDNLEGFLLKAPALSSRLGLVIQDEQASERDNRYARDCFYDRTRADTRPLLDRLLVECLSLVPSHHSVGIQLADFCMGAIGAALSKNELKYAELIESNINKERRRGKLLGLHILP